MSTTPFVSIIMPVYKAEKFIEKSVGAVLEQTFGDFELLIVNDFLCFPDGEATVKDFPFVGTVITTSSPISTISEYFLIAE